MLRMNEGSHFTWLQVTFSVPASLLRKVDGWLSYKHGVLLFHETWIWQRSLWRCWGGVGEGILVGAKPGLQSLGTFSVYSFFILDRVSRSPARLYLQHSQRQPGTSAPPVSSSLCWDDRHRSLCSDLCWGWNSGLVSAAQAFCPLSYTPDSLSTGLFGALRKWHFDNNLTSTLISNLRAKDHIASHNLYKILFIVYFLFSGTACLFPDL